MALLFFKGRIPFVFLTALRRRSNSVLSTAYRTPPCPTIVFSAHNVTSAASAATAGLVPGAAGAAGAVNARVAEHEAPNSTSAPGWSVCSMAPCAALLIAAAAPAFGDLLLGESHTLRWIVLYGQGATCHFQTVWITRSRSTESHQLMKNASVQSGFLTMTG